MAQAPDWKRLIEAGQQVTELRRSQARRIVSDLVQQGQVARDQAASVVEELLDASRRRTEELTGLIRTEVQRQLRAVGVATQDDLRALERRVSGGVRGAPGKKAPAKKAAAKKAPATKAAAKKTQPKKAPARKAAGQAPAKVAGSGS